MKKIISILVCLLAVLPTMAQGGGVQKAAKAVFSLMTFSKGTLKASCPGVFLDTQGTAVSAFSPFNGADSAVVIDSKGQQHQVDCLMGADENYDVAKFKVENGSPAGVTLATQVATGNTLWMIPYATGKPAFQKLSVSRVETFGNRYNYAITPYVATEGENSCPVVNEQGQLIGLIKALPSGTESAVTDARFANSLTTTALSIQTLNHTGIRTGLPDDEKQAEAMLMLARTTRSKKDNYKYARDFIAKFPTQVMGYQSMAELCVTDSNYAEADRQMQTAVSKCTKKDDAYSSYAQLIYNTLAYAPQGTYPAWTADKALGLVHQASAIKADPAYQHQEAQLLYLQGKYQEALKMFQALTKSSLNNGEIWYEQAQCKIQLQAPDQEVKALLDSAVSVGQRTGIVAPFYLARGRWLQLKGDYRNALRDYIVYDTLDANPGYAFYHDKYVCEMQTRQWQQALIDIIRTAYLQPSNPQFIAEWAALELRVGRMEQAEKVATACTKAAPDYSQGWLLLGIVQSHDKTKKAEALKNLRKAKELGESRADDYIAKLK